MSQITRVKAYFLLSLCLIFMLFILTSWFAYKKFNNDVMRNQETSQQRMSLIVNQLLTRYIYTFEYIASNTAAHPIFDISKSQKEDTLLYKRVSTEQANQVIQSEKLSNILLSKRVNQPLNQKNIIQEKPLYIWQLYKALPEKYNGTMIAKERREFSRRILSAFKDVHYVFQMNVNGDLIFLEPYDVQKEITSFNYGFRDYLYLVKKYKKTIVSEGYVSNDAVFSQVITIASPIFSKDKKVDGLFSVSVTAKTMSEHIFNNLAKNMGLNDGTVFYLIDRHGHVVSSSSGKNVFFPEYGAETDNNDPGNVTKLGFFREIKWSDDYYEQGNRWQRKIKKWQQSSLKDFYKGQYKNLDGNQVLATFMPITLGDNAKNWGILVETPIKQILSSEQTLKVAFAYTIAILSIILILLFYLTLRAFSKLEQRIKDKQEELHRVTSQVAHDVRSPLVALDMSVKSISGLKEAERLTVLNAVRRIYDITNDLFTKYQEADDTHKIGSPPVAENVAIVVNSVVSEKRQQYSNSMKKFIVDVGEDTYGIFSNMNVSEFKRSLSNLLNNAFDAINEDGYVSLNLSREISGLKLSISDNGCGIPEKLIPKIKSGLSLGKQEGRGLGLSTAIERFDKWGYEFNLDTKVGAGTKIDIIMPLVQPASWFKDSVMIWEVATVVVVDDDESIHTVWDKRLKESLDTNQNFTIKHFVNPLAFIDWYENSEKNNKNIFFIDYEYLGFDINGLDLIEKLGIMSNSVLVTSHYENLDIKERVIQLKTKMIPKEYSLYISLDVMYSKPNYIFIDDEPALTNTWKQAGNKLGIQVACFNTISGFVKVIGCYDKSTPVYIDSDLNDTMSGEAFAKTLYEQGYTDIYLSTGFNKNQFSDMYWIKKIVSKTPPF